MSTYRAEAPSQEIIDYFMQVGDQVDMSVFEFGLDNGVSPSTVVETRVARMKQLFDGPVIELLQRDTPGGGLEVNDDLPPHTRVVVYAVYDPEESSSED